MVILLNLSENFECRNTLIKLTKIFEKKISIYLAE